MWTRSCPDPLEVLGMILFEGRNLSVSESVLQKTRHLLSGGREKNFSCFIRVMYVNTVCLPSIRYKISALLLSKSKELIFSVDRMLRNFVRGKEWPSNTPTDFLSDTHVGLSLLSLFTESVRDLVSLVWGLCSGKESDALRGSFLRAWKDRNERSRCSSSLLADWIECIDLIDGKSFFDWNDEERELPSSLRSDSVFPFGSRGSYLSNSLQKWPSLTPPSTPCCCNAACFTNPCPLLASARASCDPVVWVTAVGKPAIKSRKGVLASILETEAFSNLVISRVSSPVLETGCLRIVREFCLCVSPSVFSFLSLSPPFLFFPPPTPVILPPSFPALSAPSRSPFSPSLSSSSPSPPLALSSVSSSGRVGHSLLVLCPRLVNTPHPPFLKEIDRFKRDFGIQVILHQVKNTSIWGLRVAKDSAILSGLSRSSPLSPPPDEWKKEVCGSPECCASPCSLYLDAVEKNDLIFWTDASFFPESHRCAAAFGWESKEGLHVTAFRVRGSAARGEVIAIFAALLFVEHCFLDRDISIFSDCEAAISKISSLNLSSLSSMVSSVDKRIINLIQRISERGRKLRLHWVKAHSGITQNEMIDASAKKEALNFRRETLFEEKPLLPGEFTLKGQLVDSRQEIDYDEWRPDLDKSVMKAARSYHARRIFAGVQQWRGLKSNWATGVKGDCVYCHDKHSLAFGIFLQRCRRCRDFRGEIERLWADVTWDDEFLEGRISHKTIRELMEDKGGTREEVTKDARARVRKWEKAIDSLCKELKGRGAE